MNKYEKFTFAQKVRDLCYYIAKDYDSEPRDSELMLLADGKTVTEVLDLVKKERDGR